MKHVHYHLTPKKKASRWYSKKQEEVFKCQRWRDVDKCSTVLMQGCDDKGTLINCLGLDKLLSQNVYQQSLEVNQAKDNNTALVLGV